MMRKIISVARWEFLEKVKTKTFIISLIITPLLIISFSVLPSLLFRQETPHVEVIGIIDQSGIYFNKLNEELKKYTLPDGQNNYVLINLTQPNQKIEELKKIGDSRVLNNLLEGYLIIQTVNSDSVLAEYRSNSFGNFEIVGRLQEAVNSVRIEHILQSEGVKNSTIGQVKDRAVVQQKKIEKEGKVSDLDFLTTFFLSLVFILLLKRQAK